MGRAAKVPSGGHSVLVAILRLLSVIVGGCDIAARQVRGMVRCDVAWFTVVSCHVMLCHVKDKFTSTLCKDNFSNRVCDLIFILFHPILCLLSFFLFFLIFPLHNYFQILDDPTNFFVLDFCTLMSESAGTPATTQISSCFFLGTCFIALVDPPLPDGSVDNANESSAHLNRKSFISMIDARIGLNRFLEVLKRPLSSKYVTYLHLSLYVISSFLFGFY